MYHYAVTTQKTCLQLRHDLGETQLHSLLWLSPMDWSTWLSKDPVNICMHPVRKWHFLCRAVNKTQHLSSVSTVKNKQWLLVENVNFHIAASTQLLMTMTYTPYRISICIVKAESTLVAAHSATCVGSLALKQAHWFFCVSSWSVPNSVMEERGICGITDIERTCLQPKGNHEHQTLVVGIRLCGEWRVKLQGAL